jgi:AcrR family transcriptional regulator
MSMGSEVGPAMTQAARRQQSEAALLESAARGLSRHGYGNLVLEQVASEAGYTRGALYHLFGGKEGLALAVVAWVSESWWDEVVPPAEKESDPLAAMVALARGHAIYCRRDVAGVVSSLRAEFGDSENPVAVAVGAELAKIITRFGDLIRAGRRSGSVPPGPSATVLAPALVGAVEGAVIATAGRAPDDEEVAERVVLGVLGLGPARTP